MFMDLSVCLIDKVYHHFYHYVFLFRLALCNHQREGNERIVSNAFGAIGTIENIVVIHEPEEESGGYPLVTIAE
jgi:hypothetical protein